MNSSGPSGGKTEREARAASTKHIESPKPLLQLILYQPEIASNTGSIGRTCVAIGARLWLIRPLGFRINDRLIRRAGLDYWDALDYRIVDTLQEVAVALPAARFCYFSTKAQQSYTSISYKAGDALVFGPESRGLPERLLEADPSGSVRIPMRPEARSLNLAVAAAIGAYEAIRQIQSVGAVGTPSKIS